MGDKIPGRMGRGNKEQTSPSQIKRYRIVEVRANANNGGVGPGRDLMELFQIQGFIKLRAIRLGEKWLEADAPENSPLFILEHELAENIHGRGIFRLIRERNSTRDLVDFGSIMVISPVNISGGRSGLEFFGNGEQRWAWEIVCLKDPLPNSKPPTGPVTAQSQIITVAPSKPVVLTPPAPQMSATITSLATPATPPIQQTATVTIKHTKGRTMKKENPEMVTAVIEAILKKFNLTPREFKELITGIKGRAIASFVLKKEFKQSCKIVCEALGMSPKSQGYIYPQINKAEKMMAEDKELASWVKDLIVEMTEKFTPSEDSSSPTAPKVVHKKSVSKAHPTRTAPSRATARKVETNGHQDHAELVQVLGILILRASGDHSVEEVAEALDVEEGIVYEAMGRGQILLEDNPELLKRVTVAAKKLSGS